MSKIIKSVELRGALLSKLPGSLMKVAVPLAKNFFVPLATITSASAIDGVI